MERKINKINDDIIEVIEVETKTTTNVTQYNKNVLTKELIELDKRIVEIDDLLKEF